ncbi:MAG: hypothetical protein FWD49_00955 [Firmicutes bacterium]|nr:hypothetical protein [Bacillota bacterium]
MSKKDKEKAEKKEKTGSGEALGSLLRVIVGFFKVLFKIITFFGLWAPALYALFGVILHYSSGFDPFQDGGNSRLFWVGFALCLVTTIIIFINNLFVKPIKNIRKGYKNPVWKKGEEESEDKKGAKKTKSKESAKPNQKAEPQNAPKGKVPPKREEIQRPKPQGGQSYAPEREMPQIYFSAREPDTLVHEYKDRFEVYKIRNGKPYIDRVEFK